MKTRKSKLIQALSFVFFSLVIALGIGTQYFAYRVNYHNSLGSPLFKKIYNPFAVLSWLTKYKNISNLSELINDTWLNISVTLLLLSAILLIFLSKRDNNIDSHGSARWITYSELLELKVLFEKYRYGDGVVLGRFKNFLGVNKTIVENGKAHISIIAPTRSGKGAGIIIPTLLNWEGSTVTLDMKNENYSVTAGFRKNIMNQKVLRFAPFSPDNSVSYNPLAEIRLKTIYEFKDSQIIADILTEPPDGMARDHWSESASALLVGIILYCSYKKAKEDKIASIGDIVDFLTSPTIKIIDNLSKIKNEVFYDDNSLFNKIYDASQLEGVKKGCHPMVSRTAAEALNKSPNEFTSIVSATLKELKLFKDPIIRRNTTKSDFKINDLVNYETPVNLYIVVEAEAQATLAPIIRILITQIVGGLCPAVENIEQKIHKHKLLLMLDEFPAFGKIPLVENSIGYVASYGIKVIIISQTINQIKQLYGDRNAILDNCTIGVYYTPGASDFETSKLISNLLGDRTIKIKNRSQKLTGGILDGTTVENKIARKLLTPEEVKNLPDNRNIILFSGQKPLMAYKIRYFEEKYFDKKVRIPINNK